MHTLNKTRDAKGMRRLWRFQSNSFITKVAKAFAAQTREAILYAKRSEKHAKGPEHAPSTSGN